MQNEKYKKCSVYPHCPICNTRLKLKDYYGKEKTPRFYCPNKSCQIKTISKTTIYKMSRKKAFWQDIYEVLLRLFRKKLPERNKTNHILCKTNKEVIKTLTNQITSLYQDKNIIKTGILRVEMSEDNFNEIQKAYYYKNKNPIICFIPVNDCLMCCAVYKNDLAKRLNLSTPEEQLTEIIEQL